jgi:hypothetical protein
MRANHLSECGAGARADWFCPPCIDRGVKLCGAGCAKMLRRHLNLRRLLPLELIYGAVTVQDWMQAHQQCALPIHQRLNAP